MKTIKTNTLLILFFLLIYNTYSQSTYKWCIKNKETVIKHVFPKDLKKSTLIVPQSDRGPMIGMWNKALLKPIAKNYKYLYEEVEYKTGPATLSKTGKYILEYHVATTAEFNRKTTYSNGKEDNDHVSANYYIAYIRDTENDILYCGKGVKPNGYLKKAVENLVLDINTQLK